MSSTTDTDVDARDATPILPAHIEDTIRAIARLHADHDRRASSVERAVERMTALLAQPNFVGVLTLLVAAWVGGNLLWAGLGHTVFDPPPFAWLQGLLALTAVYMTSLILTTQRRADRLASHREQLTLELAILAEQKSAKTIELLEELRRDNPLIRNRIDTEAAEMSRPANPETVLEALKESHENLLAQEEAAASAPQPPEAPGEAGVASYTVRGPFQV